MGWMMGPWLVFGATLLGATFTLYDGAPDYPDVDRLWALAERHRVTHLGVSPTLIRALVRMAKSRCSATTCVGRALLRQHRRAVEPRPVAVAVHAVGSGQRPIINYSGGTEISGGIVMGNPFCR
jgi:acetyl-CoA synthetase